MRFFLNITTVASLVLAGMFLGACSEPTNSAGIEIGNPTVAVSLGLTADFSVDYSSVEAKSLAKAASQEEPVVLDSFSLVMTDVFAFTSYYDERRDQHDGSKGWMVWPVNRPSYEMLDTLQLENLPTLAVSFTEETVIEKAFDQIELMDGGFLKEIGVSFKPDMADDIYGRVMIDGEYVPFEYNLSNFQTMQLRYHYTQMEIDSVKGKANVPIVFRVKRFIDGIDFSKADISEDGVIYIDQKNNSSLWSKLNENFVPSFQPLRYIYSDGEENSDTTYVMDIWNNLVAKVGENAVINGNFKSPFATDWIFHTQLGGVADTNLIVESSGDRIMQVNVTEGGDYSYSVQLMQENIALVAGVQYMCVFTVWSDVEDSITVRLGAYDTYDPVGFSQHEYVYKTGHPVQITFTPEISTPFARFELNLGKKKRKFWIKEVKVKRLSK